MSSDTFVGNISRNFNYFKIFQKYRSKIFKIEKKFGFYDQDIYCQYIYQDDTIDLARNYDLTMDNIYIYQDETIDGSEV